MMLRINALTAALKIHLSEQAHSALMQFGGYKTECRGTIFVKVQTYMPYKLTSPQVKSFNLKVNLIFV